MEAWEGLGIFQKRFRERIGEHLIMRGIFDGGGGLFDEGGGKRDFLVEVTYLMEGEGG